MRCISDWRGGRSPTYSGGAPRSGSRATPPDAPAVGVILRVLSAAVTIAGLPVMVWVLLTTLRPDLVEVMPLRGRLAALGVVVIIALLSGLLGWLHPDRVRAAGPPRIGALAHISASVRASTASAGSVPWRTAARA